jgi:hypothetical protein
MSDDWPDDTGDLIGMFNKGVQDYQKGKQDQAEVIRAEQARVFSKPEQQQGFIDKYIKLDSWNLYSEALPILIGYRPEYIHYAKADKRYTELEVLARSSANITLKIINKDDPEDKWRVLPKDVVSWAHAKEVEILYLFDNIFSSEVRNESEIGVFKNHGNSEHNAQIRASILEAAIGVIVAFPDECKTYGNISSAAIFRAIDNHSPLWFKGGVLPVSERKATEYISKAINKTQK